MSPPQIFIIHTEHPETKKLFIKSRFRINISINKNTEISIIFEVEALKNEGLFLRIKFLEIEIERY